MAITGWTLIDDGRANRKAGQSRTARYYVPATYENYLPERGDAADTDVTPVGWKVASAILDPISPASYEATVEYVASLSSSASATRPAPLWEDVQDVTELRVGYAEFMITPDMLGIAPVEQTEGEQLSDAPRYGVATKDTNGEYYTASALISRWASNPEEFTYPFKLDVSPPPKFLNRAVPVWTFEYTYYTQNASALTNFIGVNPQDDVPDTDLTGTAGKWLATDQQIEKVTDDNDTTYYRVTRTAKSAIDGFVWDESKNFGYWTF